MPTITKQKPKTVRRKKKVTSKPKGSIKKKGVTRRRHTGVDDLMVDMTFEGFSLCLYGKSGTGKTTFWSTFPGPILAIICSGKKKLREMWSIGRAEMRKKKITPLVINKSEDMKRIIDHAQQNTYGTIVLDHASSLQDKILAEILGLDKLPEQNSWGLASREEYAQCSLQTREYLRAVMDLPGKIVIVAQERNFNEDNDTDLIMPTVAAGLMPSVTGWLNPACDYICQTFIRQSYTEKKITVGSKKVIRKVPNDGVEFCLRTAPHSVYTTKFCVPKGSPLPNEIVDPDYTKFSKLINGEG